MTASPPAFESRVRELGRSISLEMQDARPGIFARDFWASKLLDRAMEDTEFKLDLFRLVDVLPSLRSGDEIHAHLQEYLARPDRKLPTVLNAALHLTGAGPVGRLAGSALRAGVTEMAERFIIGATPRDALPALRRMHRDGYAHTVDLLGEATLSGLEADAYQRRYLDLIDALADEVDRWRSAASHAQTSPLANISIKISALEPHLDSVDPRGSVARVRRRVEPILSAAKSARVFVNFDVEQYALHEVTYTLFEEFANASEFRDWPHLGIVVQAYCTRAEAYLDRLHRLASGRGAPITIRLVKGAYWDFEVMHADQHGHPQPVFSQKAQTDVHFEKLSTWLLERRDVLPPAFGTHNLRSIAHALACAESIGAPPASFEFQMLHGMAEPLREALLRRGHSVRVYSPVGDLLHGMAYLVRRLLENTANEGFLRMTYHDAADIETLLADPATQVSPEAPGSRPPFENCPHADFADVAVQQRFARAVDDVRVKLPFEVPVVIQGAPVESGEVIARHDPSDTAVVVERVHHASVDDAERAVKAAAAAWPDWRDTPLADRAELLRRLADELERDRFELAALQVFEVAKPWREADGDITEAIDFCRYYAHRALIELAPERLGGVRGETNDLWYEGRGPAVIIAPWNFPAAILCGMTVAALVAGNTVIMKPAEQSSAIAHALFDRMLRAGFPPGVVQFVPGRGEDVGAFLVDHPAIAQIAFTGSKKVGLGIVERAAATEPGQRQVKRVLCEMGGKNAIVVDADADLDEAVAGILQSAFGYAGQKCSACSRVIVVGNAWAPLVERLTAACADLVVAPAHDPACQIPPVVDEDAFRRLTGIIERPGDGAQTLFVGSAPSGGWYVPPALFEVTDANHRLMQEELFGPVVALMRVKSFADALGVATSTEFALTGSVYSRRPSHLDAARRAFRVGNLYLNRGCTGSMVGRQAFGGFQMSGIGLKAGGPGYLRQFADPRLVTENLARRGFSPDVSL